MSRWLVWLLVVRESIGASFFGAPLRDNPASTQSVQTDNPPLSTPAERKSATAAVLSALCDLTFLPFAPAARAKKPNNVETWQARLASLDLSFGPFLRRLSLSVDTSNVQSMLQTLITNKSKASATGLNSACCSRHYLTVINHSRAPSSSRLYSLYLVA